MPPLTSRPGMLPRERVFAALDFRPPDRIPLEYHPSPSGAHEHGERLRALGLAYPDDFKADEAFPAAAPDPRHFDAAGGYRELRRDDWGVLWEHQIFGACGIPLERPLDDWARLADFRAPAPPRREGEAFLAEQRRAGGHRRRHFLKSGWISLFETMHALRRFDDVLIDLAEDSAEINELADRITAYRLAEIEYFLARGVDAIQFGDDFGTQAGLMLSPRIIRRFFIPRYRRLVEPILAAGKRVFFHTCGCDRAILDDLASLGIHAIWPQLNAYNPGEVAAWSRSARVAVAIHPDRGGLMVESTPEAVRRAVHELVEEFRIAEGGSWLYVEIDSGFPLANVRALIETIGAMRGQSIPAGS